MSTENLIAKINVLRLANEKYLSIINDLSTTNIFLMNKVNKFTEERDIMKASLFFLSIFVLILVQGCSSANYKRTDPNGVVVEASANEFATDKKIQGFEYEATTDSVKVKLKDMDSNQTNGLSAIVEAAVKGAVKGVKP